MKSINQYINEALKVKAKGHNVYFVYNTQELADFLPSRYDKNTGTLNLESLSFIQADLDRDLQFRIFYPINKFMVNNNVKRVIVSNWEFGKIESLYNLFIGCFYLEEIIGLRSWDTSNIKNFSGLFSYCENIKDLSGIEKWNVSNCKNFKRMFYRCRQLQSIDLSKWMISDNITEIEEMFAGCFGLTKINGIEKWDMSNCRRFYGLFNSCKKLKSLDLSKWKIRPNNTQKMFMGCTSLTSIGDISNWDFSYDIDTEDMFNGCGKLELDMSMCKMNISVSKVRMFKDANKKIKKPNFKP